MRFYLIILINIIFFGMTHTTKAQNFGKGVTDFKGNYYPSVIIGTQEWISKNLNSSYFRNGDSIPLISVKPWDASSNWNTFLPQSCIYNNDTKNEMIYGKLYNWYVVSDSRGICPTGWRVPSNNDWDILNSYLGTDSAGYKMRDTLCCSTWTCDDAWWECTSSTNYNQSGFTAKPGSCLYEGGFGGNYPIGSTGIWWSATEINSNNADLRIISRNNDFNKFTLTNDFLSYNKKNAFSIRCIRDTVYSIITGINNLANQKILKVFPNPA
jgi:uncharacterized protein (TIGR02145 family)